MSFGQGESGNRPGAARRPAARMRELGVRPEVEIYHTGHLQACLRLAADGLLAEPLQFSIVAGVHGGMAATPQNLVTTVCRLGPGAIWQVIVTGLADLSRTAIGPAEGGTARAGLDDTPHLRKGELAAGHRPPARRAIMLAPGLDLPAAGMAEAERDLGIAS